MRSSRPTNHPVFEVNLFGGLACRLSMDSDALRMEAAELNYSNSYVASVERRGVEGWAGWVSIFGRVATEWDKAVENPRAP